MQTAWIAFNFLLCGILGGAILVTHTDLSGYHCVAKDIAND